MASPDPSSPFDWPTSPEDARAAPPARYPDAFVRFECRCGGRVDAAWVALTTKFGTAPTIGDQVQRYRCAWCRQAPYLVMMMDRSMDRIQVVQEGQRRPIVLISNATE